MASQLANILTSFGSQTAATSGSGLREGVKGYYAEKDKAVARRKLDAETDKMNRASVIEALKGPIAAANTADKWKTAQQSGFIPKEMDFTAREPFIMGNMTESALKTTEVGDPTSSTGTRIVRTMDAPGMEGKPKSGTSLTVDKEGNVSFQSGAGVSGGVTKTVKSKVQQKILDKGDVLSQVTTIKNTYKPEYQQIGARVGFAWNAMRDKFNDTPIGNIFGDLNPDEAKSLDEYTTYRAAAAQNFSTILNDISGVAVNPTEFKRAEAWLPNPGSGVFDGDSPIELKSKIDRMDRFTRNAMMKYSYINKNGLTVNDVDVSDMPKLMNERGDDLMLKFSKEGLRGDILENAVKQSLSDEFGLSYD